MFFVLGANPHKFVLFGKSMNLFVASFIYKDRRIIQYLCMNDRFVCNESMSGVVISCLVVSTITVFRLDWTARIEKI